MSPKCKDGLLCTSLHFYSRQTPANIREKHKTICWAAEIIITWSPGINLLLSPPERTLTYLFISFVLRNVNWTHLNQTPSDCCLLWIHYAPPPPIHTHVNLHTSVIHGCFWRDNIKLCFLIISVSSHLRLVVKTQRRDNYCFLVLQDVCWQK